MKKWTCYIISVLLVALSAVRTDVNDLLNYSVSALLGISSVQTASNELYIDLTQTNEAVPEPTDTASPTASPELAKSHSAGVLIYHTHTDEAYFKGEQDYIETSVGRTQNEAYNVVGVGASFKDALENYGFTVIHDKSDNVSGDFNGAYQTSYDNIKKYIGKIDVYVDMHRDAYSGEEPNFITVNGTEYSYICFVVANGGNYSVKPNYDENYALAQRLTDKLNEICPGIAKKVIVKNARLNQHISTSCVLAEMGNEQNSLAQVKASAGILAEAFDCIFD